MNPPHCMQWGVSFGALLEGRGEGGVRCEGGTRGGPETTETKDIRKGNRYREFEGNPYWSGHPRYRWRRGVIYTPSQHMEEGAAVVSKGARLALVCQDVLFGHLSVAEAARKHDVKYDAARSAVIAFREGCKRGTRAGHPPLVRDTVLRIRRLVRKGSG